MGNLKAIAFILRPPTTDLINQMKCVVLILVVRSNRKLLSCEIYVQMEN